MFKATRAVILTLLFPVFCLADVPEGQRAEVQHLIAYVKNSACRMDRNGTWHANTEAAEHIERKYHYFRDEIMNTEDFIRLSATKSTWSGKHYRVQCAGEAIENSAQWLLRELQQYRQTRKTPSPFPSP